MILLMPLVFVVYSYLIYDEKKRDKLKKKREDNMSPPKYGIYFEKYPSLNELRASNNKQFGEPRKLKPKSKLELFVEEHGKQLAAYMEKDAFIIPLSNCKDVADELIIWLNKLENVKYALLEEDGIHVEMRGEF